MNESSIQKSKSMEIALYTQATDVAGLCRDIVVKTAIDIQGKKFVPVEAWTTIAVAHGCIATIKSVTVIAEGMIAVAEIRRQSDGQVLTSAEGFVGIDEPVWYGGPGERWNKIKRCMEEVIYKKRPDYAIRAMVQTRAVSRACRTAFSHVVVLMNAGLSTVPYEEMAPDDDTIRGDAEENGAISREQDKKQADAAGSAKNVTPTKTGEAKPNIEVPRDETLALRDQFRKMMWEKVVVHFGQNKGKTLKDLSDKSLMWYIDEWQPKPYGTKGISEEDKILRAALDVAKDEAFKQ